ncbi:hypothetical protein ACIQCG_39000 [Streptomyces noursei]|uniref:hypothetical protein n=1 Tax=Streptomyces noursei TaxID=1971 RepID=UPI0037F4BF6B
MTRISVTPLAERSRLREGSGCRVGGGSLLLVPGRAPSPGQGTYPSTIQNALAHTQSALRYFPDLIAARDGEVITIDAKDRMPSTHTDRYAISTATLNAGLLFTAAHAPTPLYYVFGDLKVLTPSEVHHYATHARPHRSGAWVLVATRRAHPFEEVFGSPPALAA